MTSAFGSYSGCRQYIEDIDRGRATVENAPAIDKIRPFSGHPKFLEAMTDRVRAALGGTSRRTPGVHRAFRAGGDGAVESLRAELREASAAVAARWAGQSGISPGRAAAARPRSRGWSRISATICARLAWIQWWCRSVSIRPHGSYLRSGRGGSAGGRRAGYSHRAGAYG